MMRAAPESYQRALRAMRDAALAWLRSHPGVTLALDFSLGGALEPGEFYIGSVAAVLPKLAQDQTARDFLQVMLAVTDGYATYAMTRAVVESVFRPQGSA